MRRRPVALAALLWCGLAAAEPAGGLPGWPEPIRWGDEIPDARVASALLEALANCKWQVEARDEGSITARHEANERELRIRLDYSPQRVSYQYVDSRNYAYAEENGQRYIHRRARRIIARLDREVRTQIQRLRFERGEPTEVVPADPAPPEDAPAPGES